MDSLIQYGEEGIHKGWSFLIELCLNTGGRVTFSTYLVDASCEPERFVTTCVQTLNPIFHTYLLDL